MTFLYRLNLTKLDFTQNLSGSKMIKCQQSQALTSHFESFWSIVICRKLYQLSFHIIFETFFTFFRPCGRTNKISLGFCGRFTSAELLSFSISMMVVFIWIMTGITAVCLQFFVKSNHLTSFHGVSIIFRELANTILCMKILFP